MLDGHDNVCAILKSPPRRVSTYVCALFSHRKCLVVTPFLGKSHIQKYLFIWSQNRSQLASSWMIKNLIYFLSTHNKRSMRAPIVVTLTITWFTRWSSLEQCLPHLIQMPFLNMMDRVSHSTLSLLSLEYI